VVRRSLSNIKCQVIEHSPKGDVTKVAAEALELRTFGWMGNTGNIPSAYLTGFLCGLRAKKTNVKGCIPDMGLYRSIKGSRLYAALKGALDAGLDIAHSDVNLPDKDRAAGVHIAKFAESLKGKSSYNRMFSLYLKNKLKPEELPKHFEEVKAKLLKGGPGAAGKIVKKGVGKNGNPKKKAAVKKKR
jgi:large subunit ribosomal protein L18